MSRAPFLLILAALLLSGCGRLLSALVARSEDPLTPAYGEHCVTCHGAELEGTPIGPALVAGELHYGESVSEVANSIAAGFPGNGMPAFGATLDEAQIRGLAVWITERRANFSRIDFRVDAPLEIPRGAIESERHAFRIETVATDLHPRPFSIAPLPDGRILVSEKTLGLSFVEPDGTQSPHVEGTPPTHDDGFELLRLNYGIGWMLEAAPHPDYAENGWIYLHFGDRCEDCSTSMNKLVRGRIRDGRWVDEETIWAAAPETYTRSSDLGAGGRVCFDGDGHVFLSIGIKGHSNHHGIQDLSLPYGKIHRVHDDGRVPDDNPFVDRPGALPTTWTYGHRSPQGLEFDPATGRLWQAEMGPRGGDELNLLRPGHNYGWPLVSKGLNYDGTPVAYGVQLGIEPDLDAIEQPVVDMTPSPAVSSLVIYHGSAFPEWEGDAIVATLKASQLYRFVIDGERVVHRETLIDGLARIRDVEVAHDGTLLLLLEHGAGSRIVRIVPEPRTSARAAFLP